MFKVIVDNGKPYEEVFEDEKGVKECLKELDKTKDKEDYAYFDVMVLDSLENDVTDYFFNNLKGGLK